jgi:EAL domain-containing protein (putative c-di-GMP-specific phosphodiesterase class I)
MSRLMMGEGALRRALCEGHITPAFQPVIREPGSVLHGVEVLARWYQPDGSVITPDRFIPQVVRSGLEPALARTLMKQAVPTVRTLAAVTGRPVVVGFNAGPACLADPEFAGICEDFLAACGDTGAGLAVEVTEREPLHPELVPTLDRLRTAGIRLVLDDYGTGYAMQQVLPWLQPDVVKIDRSLTALAGKGDPEGLLARTLEALRRYSVTVLAEGVETSAEYRWLRARGIPLFQGWLTGRPMAGEALIASLRSGALDKAGNTSGLSDAEKNGLLFQTKWPGKGANRNWSH